MIPMELSSVLMPEAALAAFAMIALLVGAFLGKDRTAGAVLWASVVAMLIAAFAVGFTSRVDAEGFWGMFIDDAFARFAKVTILTSAAGSASWPRNSATASPTSRM